MSTWNELKNNARLKKIYDERMLITKSVREFFWRQGFVEAETSLAMWLPGQEPYLNPVPLKLKNALNESFDFHLRTSPEFNLKKLLAAGYDKIFEVGKCFRDAEDFGGTHFPEFTMIEWYRAPGKLTDIMDDTEKLFKFVMKKIGKNIMIYNGKEVDVKKKWERKSMKQLFKKFLNVNLDNFLETESLKKLAEKLNYDVKNFVEYEDVFFKIFLNEIEPKLGGGRPIFVYDYPARMCSLSKLSESDPRYAERFELYVAGLEVANAFGELLDADEQNKRLEADKTLRTKLGKETWPVDQDFIEALPEVAARAKEAGGVALGLDRMVVLCTGARDIKEVVFENLADQTAK